MRICKVSDLTEANLVGANLSNADLSFSALRSAKLDNSLLSFAKITSSDLNEVTMLNANLKWIELLDVRLNNAKMSFTQLSYARIYRVSFINSKMYRVNLENSAIIESNFTSADLYRSFLIGTTFTRSNLKHTNLGFAHIGETTLNKINLTQSKGLHSCIHRSPSSLDHFTLSFCHDLPKVFLHGVGLSDYQIEYYKLEQLNLTNAEINRIIYRIYDLRAHQSVQINPLFISYNHSDSTFVEKLEPYLLEKGIRFWRDIHHLKAGKLEKQVDRAMRLNPTVLLILSENSVNSDWVEHEAESARELEKELGRDVLCPVALDDSWQDCKWDKRLRRQIEKYNILDFSQWKDEEVFKRQFSRLLDGLDIYYK